MRTKTLRRPRRLSTPAAIVAGIACALTLGLTASSSGADLLLVTDPVSLGNPADPLAFDQELIEMLEDYVQSAETCQ